MSVKTWSNLSFSAALILLEECPPLVEAKDPEADALIACPVLSGRIIHGVATFFPVAYLGFLLPWMGLGGGGGHS